LAPLEPAIVRSMFGISPVLSLLPWQDWAAAFVFVAGWAGYAQFARTRSRQQHSLLVLTNRERRAWMWASTFRDNRVFDGVVVQNLSASPSFFASTTILIIGGLLALLGTSEKASELVKEIPFAARTTALVFDLKLFGLLGIFIYAFFRFTWSLRLYSFGALIVAAAPDSKQFENDQAREFFADRAGGVMGLAAETFNDGLRAYYFSFAMVCWFFSPLVFALATAGVIYILFRREFQSDVLELLSRRADNERSP
jgi:uncharacterized membrane protein